MSNHHHHLHHHSNDIRLLDGRRTSNDSWSRMPPPPHRRGYDFPPGLNGPRMMMPPPPPRSNQHHHHPQQPRKQQQHQQHPRQDRYYNDSFRLPQHNHPHNHQINNPLKRLSPPSHHHLDRNRHDEREPKRHRSFGPPQQQQQQHQQQRSSSNNVIGSNAHHQRDHHNPNNTTMRIKQEKGDAVVSIRTQNDSSTPTTKSNTNERINEEKEKKNDDEERPIQPSSSIASSIHQKEQGKENFVDLLSLEDTFIPSETHIIFAIDFSSSMKKNDVKTKHGKISRWNAVFQCIRSLLEEQLTNQNNHGDDDEKNNKHNNTSDSTSIVSVMIFNEEAKTLLDRMPLVGDGQKVVTALDTARKMYKPKGGTGFSAGFKHAKLLAAKAKTLDPNNHNVMLVFLSDGRPGDLIPNPPSDGEPMQITFKRRKTNYPAAGTHVEAMKQKHGDRFSLQLVCLSDEGTPWLQYLANQYNGTFHKPDLTLDEDEGTPVLEQAVSNSESDHRSDSNNDLEDEVLDMKVKSNDTLIRENYNRAKLAGKVLSLANTTARSSSSMRSTFQSISSAVTSLRNGSNRREERRIMMAAESPMIEFEATRMVLDDNHEKFSVASGEKVDGRRVKVSLHPFAQGGLRNVYRMHQIRERRQVAKESRHDIKDQERLKFHVETSKCQARARILAKTFNKTMKKCNPSVPRIDFLRTEVYRLRDPSYPRGFRYLAVEDEMGGDGQKYEKWNSNTGFVHPSDSTDSQQCHVAQAFSHFSYEDSNEEEMVVDIQGSGFVYTDPQLHSKTKEFGRADRGESGFRDFFSTHKCNCICKELGLTNRSTTTVAANSTSSVAVKQEII